MRTAIYGTAHALRKQTSSGDEQYGRIVCQISEITSTGNDHNHSSRIMFVLQRIVLLGCCNFY